MSVHIEVILDKNKNIELLFILIFPQDHEQSI